MAAEVLEFLYSWDGLTAASKECLPVINRHNVGSILFSQLSEHDLRMSSPQPPSAVLTSMALQSF
jgi:hypothetical protein